MEPLVRAALERLATSDPRLAGTAAVGGYWTRTGSAEVPGGRDAPLVAVSRSGCTVRDLAVALR